MSDLNGSGNGDREEGSGVDLNHDNNERTVTETENGLRVTAENSVPVTTTTQPISMEPIGDTTRASVRLPVHPAGAPSEPPTTTNNTQSLVNPLMSTGHTTASIPPSSSNQNQGGLQFIGNNIQNPPSHDSVDRMAGVLLRTMYETFLQTSTPAAGSVRPRDTYPIPGLSTIPPSQRPAQPVFDTTHPARPVGDRPGVRPSNIGERLIAMSNSPGGSPGAPGLRGPSCLPRGNGLGSRSISEVSQQGTVSEDERNRQIAEEVNRILAEGRSSERESATLDRDLCAGLHIPDVEVLQAINHDYSAEVSKRRAIEVVRWYLRVSQADTVPTRAEILNLLTELEEIRQFLNREGRNGPSDPGWRELLRMLLLMISRIENLRLRIANTDDQNNSTASSSQGNMSGVATDPEVYLALKTIRKFDGKNPEEYLRYFNQVSGHLPLAMRKTLLENNMGPKYMDRLKNIRYLTTWNAVMNEVMKEFSSTPCNVTASLALNRLTQGSRDIRRYNDKVCRLLAMKDQVPENIKDTDMITRYLSGLSDGKIRKYLLNKLMNKDTRMEKTLHKFMELARDDENKNRLVHSVVQDVESSEDEEVLVASDKKIKVKSETVRAADVSVTSGLDPNVQCQRHDAGAHTNADCRHPAGSCPYCNKTGIPASKFQDGSHKRECDVRSCGNCGMRGHYARECFRSQENGRGRDRDRPRNRDGDRRERREWDRRDRDRGYGGERKHKFHSRDRKEHERRRPRDTHRSSKSDKYHKGKRDKFEKKDKRMKRDKVFVAEVSESSSCTSSGTDRSSSGSRSKSPA